MDIAKIASELEHTGYIVLAKPLVDKLLADLFTRCHDDDPTRFHAAQVGRGAAKQQIDSIRGDVIDWLDASNTTDHAYLDCMEELRLGLNAALYLGLFDYESHYAIYGEGDGYAKHSDVLQGAKNRILTTVLYLNEDWHACDGGELVLMATAAASGRKSGFNSARSGDRFARSTRAAVIYHKIALSKCSAFHNSQP